MGSGCGDFDFAVFFLSVASVAVNSVSSEFIFWNLVKKLKSCPERDPGIESSYLLVSPIFVVLVRSSGISCGEFSYGANGPKDPIRPLGPMGHVALWALGPMPMDGGSGRSAGMRGAG